MKTTTVEIRAELSAKQTVMLVQLERHGSAGAWASQLDQRTLASLLDAGLADRESVKSGPSKVLITRLGRLTLASRARTNMGGIVKAANAAFQRIRDTIAKRYMELNVDGKRSPWAAETFARDHSLAGCLDWESPINTGVKLAERRAQIDYELDRQIESDRSVVLRLARDLVEAFTRALCQAHAQMDPSYLDAVCPVEQPAQVQP